jgi:Flp pilus assembly protein TadD
MRGLVRIQLAAALAACAGSAAFVAAAPAAAHGSYSPYNETPAAALARYIRALADDPKDFQSLIGAGRSALELGDTQAAAGFFARADAVNPRSPLPQAGMGAVQVAKGDARAAMPYFRRAQKLGISSVLVGCDLGLAYDLLGQQAQAQADYRTAMAGADTDEARRRLALSLAISGDKAQALGILAPLMAKGDAEAARARAFILALTGDANGARVAFDAAMPGSWSRVAPFLARLNELPAGEKAAAVNLGIFPDSNRPAYAYNNVPTVASASISASGSVDTDRLAGIEALLQSNSPPPPAAQRATPPKRQLASATPIKPATVRRTATVQDRKIWLQLASGRNTDDLAEQFKLLKARHRTLFRGIDAYLASESSRTRLLIGPFRGSSDADIFAEDLDTIGVDAFKWTNSASDRIVPLASR